MTGETCHSKNSSHDSESFSFPATWIARKTRHETGLRANINPPDAPIADIVLLALHRQIGRDRKVKLIQIDSIAIKPR